MSKAWLSNHLNKFVKPYLGVIPAPSYRSNQYSLVDEESLTTLIKTWQLAKQRCGNKTMLLAGRDVWEFEILARLDGFPTEFRPDISSNTVNYIEKDYSNYYLIDSGYSGTIPVTLGVKKWNLVSGTRALKRGESFFDLADYLEDAPKYWTRADMVKGKIFQKRSGKLEFAKAAIMTQIIAKFYMSH